MISKSELLQGRDKTFASEYTQQISHNLDILLEKLNVVRSVYGHPMIISSGWRPAAVNASLANAAPHSGHMIGVCADVQDLDGKLRDWVLQNLDLMKSLGLWIEDFRYTKGWVHFGWMPPASKRRIFIPNKGLPPNPEWWPNPKYDSRFDG